MGLLIPGKEIVRNISAELATQAEACRSTRDGAIAVTCEVALDQIEVMADIGVYASEAGRPQPLWIDVAVTIVPPSGDDLATSFDYATILSYACELAGERIALIETFAERLARRCLAHPSALSAEVRVAKPWAIAGALARVTLRLSRS